MTTEFMKYDSTTDQLHLQIASESVQDVVLNKELILHVSKSEDGGYIIDLYNYSNWNNDYMFDEDYFKTIYVTRDDLYRSITYRMQVDEDNIPTFDDYHLIGSKLYHNEELVGEDVDEDYIIKTILDNAVERVYSIEIEGGTIYNRR